MVDNETFHSERRRLTGISQLVVDASGAAPKPQAETAETSGGPEQALRAPIVHPSLQENGWVTGEPEDLTNSAEQPRPGRRRMGDCSAAQPGAGMTPEPSIESDGAKKPNVGSPSVSAAAANQATAAPVARRSLGTPGAASDAPAGPRRMGAVEPAEVPAPVRETKVEARTPTPAGDTRPTSTTELGSPTPSTNTTSSRVQSRSVKSLAIVAGIVLASLAIVLLARWLRTVSGVEAFIADYSGHASQPASAPAGIPSWLGWQHFLNMFFMVLIVRTGLQVRWERRPPGYWTPRKGSFFSPGRQAPKKISLSQWLHQCLDVLWVGNGLVFIVLLFASGQWMRIVPAGWDVFPHMLSAGLQYASLDWPAEDGWVHYNALQVMAYFVTVMIAAPLAILSGIRLSTWWPTGNEKLSRLYPVEVARAIHIPVMIYFVVFTIVHVFLVFFTGALGNLNHMYTSRDTVDLWGLVVFLVSLVVVAVGWLLTSQMFVRPVAGKMGKVTKN